jgi:hypothetical protein
MGAVPVDKAGVGSAVINSMRQVGGSLGIAIMGTLVAGSIQVGPADQGYAAQFVHGYHRALYAGAVIVSAGAIVSVLTVRKLRQHGPEASAKSPIGTSPTLGEAA